MTETAPLPPIRHRGATIVDYGVGNIRSLIKLFESLDAPVDLASTPGQIARSSRLILPGVGHFSAAMAELGRRDLVEALNRRVLNDGVPLLGICLGMHLLGTGSEEGAGDGLGWIDAAAVRFRFDGELAGFKSPNMGWRTVAAAEGAELFSAAPERPCRFYFAHSYHLVCRDPGMAVAHATYGYSFVAAVRQDNIWGVQFHPEKSHGHGRRLLDAFSRL